MMTSTENPIPGYVELSGANVLDKFKLLQKEDQKVVIYCEEIGKNRKSLIARMQKINAPKMRGRRPGTKNKPKPEPTVPVPPLNEPSAQPSQPSQTNPSSGGEEGIAPTEQKITENRRIEKSSGIIRTEIPENEKEKAVGGEKSLPAA